MSWRPRIPRPTRLRPHAIPLPAQADCWPLRVFEDLLSHVDQALHGGPPKKHGEGSSKDSTKASAQRSLALAWICPARTASAREACDGTQRGGISAQRRRDAENSGDQRNHTNYSHGRDSSHHSSQRNSSQGAHGSSLISSRNKSGLKGSHATKNTRREIRVIMQMFC